MTDQTTNASEALRYATEAQLINDWNPEQRHILAATAHTFALLAVADSIDRLNARTSTEHQHTRALGNPACLTCGAIEQEEPVEPTTDAEWAEQIERLAADLWKADPSRQTPARRFDDDYGYTQDNYRAMARAALGIHDEPKDKK